MSCSDASGTAAPSPATYSQPGLPVYTQLLGQPSSLPWTGSPWPLSAQAGRELLVRATGSSARGRSRLARLGFRQSGFRGGRSKFWPEDTGAQALSSRAPSQQRACDHPAVGQAEKATLGGVQCYQPSAVWLPQPLLVTTERPRPGRRGAEGQEFQDRPGCQEALADAGPWWRTRVKWGDSHPGRGPESLTGRTWGSPQTQADACRPEATARQPEAAPQSAGADAPPTRAASVPGRGDRGNLAAR